VLTRILCVFLAAELLGSTVQAAERPSKYQVYKEVTADMYAAGIYDAPKRDEVTELLECPAVLLRAETCRVGMWVHGHRYSRQQDSRIGVVPYERCSLSKPRMARHYADDGLSTVLDG